MTFILFQPVFLIVSSQNPVSGASIFLSQSLRCPELCFTHETCFLGLVFYLNYLCSQVLFSVVPMCHYVTKTWNTAFQLLNMTWKIFDKKMRRSWPFGNNSFWCNFRWKSRSDKSLYHTTGRNTVDDMSKENQNRIESCDDSQKSFQLSSLIWSILFRIISQSLFVCLFLIPTERLKYHQFCIVPDRNSQR